MHRTTYPLAHQGPQANQSPLAPLGAPPPRTPPPSVAGAASPGTRPLDHHLWRNGRLWWIAITLHDAKGHRRRVRRSLGTDDVADARWQRDRFIDRVRRAGEWTIAEPARRNLASASEIAA